MSSIIFGANRAGGVTESFGAPDGAWQVRAVTSCRYQDVGLWDLLMTPGGLGLVCGGKQEDALWFLWCVAEGSRRGTWVVSFPFFDTYSQKKNNKNPKIYCNKLPARGVSSEAELSLGCWEPEQPPTSSAGRARCRAPMARRSPSRHRQMCGLSLVFCLRFQSQGMVLAAAQLSCAPRVEIQQGKNGIATSPRMRKLIEETQGWCSP